jgi:ribonuclease HI
VRVAHNPRNPLNYQIETREQTAFNKIVNTKQRIGNTMLKFVGNTTILQDPEEQIANWSLKKPSFNFELTNEKNNSCSNAKRKQNSLKEIRKYPFHFHMYTDGSKIKKRVGYGIWSEEFEVSGRLRNHSSIFSAEAYAIMEAIKKGNKHIAENILIISDSLSVLKSIQKYDHKETLIRGIKIELNKTEKNYTFLWIPSHIQLNGNERADELAKEGIDEEQKGWITKRDALNLCKIEAEKMFDKYWKEQPRNNILKTIKKDTKKALELNSLKRKDAIIITRLRIGHTRLTHKYLFTSLKQKEKCQCNEDLTVKHILADCTYFENIRNRHNVDINDLKSKNKKKLTNIINYLKEIQLYEEI